jgi:DNA-binding NarL/FixJ family response regulator
MTSSQIVDFPGGQRLIGVRVALIEDHALLAESLRMSMAAEGADVGLVGLTSTQDIVEACARHRPHVVLLDLDLGPVVGDGEVLIPKLVADGVRVVLLTGSTDAARLGSCLERGAIGVIAKAEPLDSLVEQVRRVARGERVLATQRRLELLLESRRERSQREHRLAPFGSLTEREQEVLAELMHGRAVEEISHSMFLSEATVRTHVRAILQKLGVRSQLAAVARAREVGWPS